VLISILIPAIIFILYNILFKTLVEEIVFRAFQLGITTSGISLVKYKRLPFYWTNSLKNALTIVTLTFFFGEVFSFSHVEWIYEFSYFYTRLSLGFALGWYFSLQTEKFMFHGLFIM